MARPKTFITDFRHLSAAVSAEDVVKGRSLAAFLASIVAAGSLEAAEARIRSPLRCRCRPRRRACPGVILIERHRGHPELEWRCSECELNGIITNWQGSAWDIGKAPQPENVEVLAPELPRNRVPVSLAGRWRIVEMEVWGREAIDLMGPAFINLAKHSASLRFIAVEGGLDCRYGEIGGCASVEFSWMGADDRDAASGRGWAQLQADGSLTGRIFIHDGDDSSFKAMRFEDPTPSSPRRRGMH